MTLWKIFPLTASASRPKKRRDYWIRSIKSTHFNELINAFYDNVYLDRRLLYSPPVSLDSILTAMYVSESSVQYLLVSIWRYIAFSLDGFFGLRCLITWNFGDCKYIFVSLVVSVLMLRRYSMFDALIDIRSQQVKLCAPINFNLPFNLHFRDLFARHSVPSLDPALPSRESTACATRRLEPCSYPIAEHTARPMLGRYLVSDTFIF